MIGEWIEKLSRVESRGEQIERTARKKKNPTLSEICFKSLWSLGRWPKCSAFTSFGWIFKNSFREEATKKRVPWFATWLMKDDDEQQLHRLSNIHALESPQHSIFPAKHRIWNRRPQRRRRRRMMIMILFDDRWPFVRWAHEQKRMWRGAGEKSCWP